jgi:cathepsin D
MTMQGTAISLGSSQNVAVDTGTTLIGGPASVIAAIYAAIPGSSQMTGSYANYYQYPCSTSINFQITIGGYTIQITDADFNLGRYSSDNTMCTGAAFIQALSSSSPVQWILGDTALKNVYSVYRYNPPAVGFAALAGAATASTQGVSTTIPVVGSSLGGVTGGVGTMTSGTGSGSGSAGNSTATSTGSSGSGSVSGSVSGSTTSSAGGASSTSSKAGASSGGSQTPHVVTATSTAFASEPTDAAQNAVSSSGTTSGVGRVLSVPGLGVVIGLILGSWMI